MANEPEVLETHQQRISEIQDVSDVIAVANLQLGKLLQKFEWTKRSLQDKEVLKACPFDSSHQMKETHFSEHVKICNSRKHNMMSVNAKDFVSSTSFCYEGTNIVSINLSVEDYEAIGVKVPGKNSFNHWVKYRQTKDKLNENSQEIPFKGDISTPDMSTMSTLHIPDYLEMEICRIRTNKGYAVTRPYAIVVVYLPILNPVVKAVFYVRRKS